MAARIASLITAVLVATAMVACGPTNPPTGDGSEDAVVVGSADFTESELLMEIYAAALRKTGIEVRTRPRLGSREITNPAVADGSITVMPEYSGNLLYSVDPQATATTADDVYAALQRALPRGLEVLNQSEAENSDVLVTTPQTAAALQLTSMDRLGSHCATLTLGAADEWQARWKDKIAQVYGCAFREIRSTDAAGPVTLEALRSGQSQVVNLFTTSPHIAANQWVALADPKHMYPAQRIVALVRAGTLEQASIDALNKVSAALSTAKLTELNWRIIQERAVPADLAEDFVNGWR
ncbi:MAG: ABC transporter substrate-binding protein [Pseudonocardiaceae bacterium]